MALRTVASAGSSKFVYTSKMNVGDQAAGFYIGMKTGRFGDIIVFQNEDGTTSDILTSGSLRYVRKNAEEDASKKLALGQWTVITKSASYQDKNNKPKNLFTIQQDDERTVQNFKTHTIDTAAEGGSETQTRSVDARLAAMKKKIG